MNNWDYYMDVAMIWWHKSERESNRELSQAYHNKYKLFAEMASQSPLKL